MAEAVELPSRFQPGDRVRVPLLGVRVITGVMFRAGQVSYEAAGLMWRSWQVREAGALRAVKAD